MPGDGARERGLAGLSEREHVVATKFAAGLTYREIGEALFIAPTTVRSHLSAIYQKLGVRNKVALAALLAAGGRVSASPTTEWPDEAGPTVVAVLPFDNLSAEERWNRVADGLSADITADLARYRDLAVISRQTMQAYKGRQGDARAIGRELNADYLIEGTLQADRDRARIGIQLVDARKGTSLWSSRYEHATDDLFAMLDGVTESVVNILATCHGKLANLRREAVRRKPPASLRAYECYLLGVEQNDLFTRASHQEAIRLLSRAVELDPGLSRAWTELGCAHAAEVCGGHSTDLERTILQWEHCLRRALSLDPGDNHARILHGDLAALRGDPAAAALEYERVLAATPYDADTLALLAGSLALVVGDPERGCELARRAIRLNPHVPWYFGMLGRSNFAAGYYREAVTALRQAPPDSPPTLLFLAMAHAMLDETAQSAKLAARLAKEFPELSADVFVRSYPVTNPPALAAMREGARRAGLA
ncbi:LuxR C-terminal-related transcriptional regulator [Labrys miyagiensis]